MVSATEVGPLLVDLLYDQQIVTIPAGGLNAWKMLLDGFLRSLLSLTKTGPNTLQALGSGFGIPIPGRQIRYTPPPDSVENLLGVAALPQPNFPIP